MFFLKGFYGTNILGYGAIDTSHGSRIVSFFKDEPIAGAYINGFLFLILGYISLVLKKRGDFYKYFSLLFFVLFLISVLVTGERSNTIKAILGFSIFFLFLDFFKIKFKLLFFFLIISLISSVIIKSDFLKNRYIGQLYNNIIYEKKKRLFFGE